MSGQGAVRLTEAEMGVLCGLIVDNPMWIGADGEPLDYLPERETYIGHYLTALTDVVEAIAAPRVSSALEPIEALAATFDREAEPYLFGGRRHQIAGDRLIARAETRALDADRIRVALTRAAPVPPADETEPQAGASGDGGGLG